MNCVILSNGRDQALALTEERGTTKEKPADQARREAEGARAASRQKSGRWKKAGSSERRRARRAGEAARRVTWPSLRPGRGDLPKRWRWASGTARTSDDSGRSPIRLSMAQWPAAAVEPRGKLRTARRWFSNWLVTAPSIVQWPELWTRGAISLASSSPRCSKNSMASTPTYFRDSRTRRAAFSAARWMEGSRRGAGARERRRMPLRWWFSTSG